MSHKPRAVHIPIPVITPTIGGSRQHCRGRPHQPLRPRLLAARKTFRPEHFAHLDRAWRRQIPALGRLGLAVERSKQSLVLGDIRLSASSYRRLDWETDAYENGLSLIIYDVRLRPGQDAVKSLLIAAISLHCLARRYQRSFKNDDATMFADLSVIGLNAKELLGQSVFRQPAGDGAWHGEAVLATYRDVKQRTLAVRTLMAG